MPNTVDSTSGNLRSYVPTALAVLAAVVTIVWVSTTYRYWTLSNDGGYYLMMTREVIAGATPVVDFESIHTPGIFYLEAFFLKLHGGSPTALAMQCLLTNLFVASALGVSLWRLGMAKAGTSAVAAAVCFVLYPSYEGMPLMLEPLSSCFGWLGVVLTSMAVVPRRTVYGGVGWPFLFCGGCAAGVAAMVKQPGAVFAIVVAVVATAGAPNRKLIRLGIVAAGAALPLFAFAAYRPAALFGLLQQVIVQTFQYAINQKYSVSYSLQDRVFTFSLHSWIWFSLIAGALAAWKAMPSHDPAESARRRIMFAVAAAGTVLLVPSFSRPYAHYFLYPIPFALFCFASAASTLRRPTRSAVNFVALLAPLLAITPVAINTFYFYRNRLPGDAAAQREIVDFISEEADSSQSILIVPAAPQYYYLTGRVAPVVYYGYFHERSHLSAAAAARSPVFIVCDTPSEVPDSLKDELLLVGYRPSKFARPCLQSWLLPDRPEAPALDDASRMPRP